MYSGARSVQLWFALTLILVGVLLLLRNYAGWQIDNWWALFFLLPAIGSLWGAYWVWRTTGLGYAVAGPLITGLVFLTIAAIFLLQLEWGKIWPVFLLLGGFGALLPTLLRRRRQE
jgi:hypothetical protein